MVVIGLFYLLSIVFLILAVIPIPSRLNLFALGVLFFVLAVGFPQVGLISSGPGLGLHSSRLR